YLGTGRLPFYSESVHELLAMHGSDEAAPPMTGVPHRLAMVVGKLLEKDPRRRYQTAAEALQALEMSLATNTPVHGVPWPSDTSPSIGPFPADSKAFAHLETPMPPSLATDRLPSGKNKEPRARSVTEVERIVAGETMLAPSASAVPATSQPGTSSLAGFAPTRKRWPLIAAATGVFGVAVIVSATLLRGGDGTAKDPAVDPEPTVVDTKPADPKPAVVDTKPADPTPAVVDTKPIVVETKPVENPVTVAKPTKPTKPTTTRPTKPTTTKPVKPSMPFTTTPNTNTITPKPGPGSAATKPGPGSAKLPF
ncbi:MAG: serine/threonine protein kinase, partial [Deltaproteobacteria bacterium]|nr:serine/threonine protein kinase [Deltaproteobacteria bacterium]